MKKVLRSLALGVFVVGLLVPELVSAQFKRPQECCKIRHEITVKTSDVGKLTLKSGEVVGAPAAQNPVCDIQPDEGKNKFATRDWGVFCLLNTLYTVTVRFFYGAIAGSTIVILLGAYTILLAAGEPERMKRGRTMVIYA
ncbi:hypothetical protein KJA17_02705, partial [Patescibacteria group bacterium]|nr:hypothetical protein [Patescibacteria group bacterium]